MDIVKQIKNRFNGEPYDKEYMFDTAVEEIEMLRDRLRGLRQKLAELGADTDLT